MDTRTKPSFLTFFKIASVAVTLWIVVLCFGIESSGLPLNATLPNLGLFGDMFGGINALFSALAMSGAIYALIAQGWQIREQKRHDLDLYRRQKLEEIALQTSALFNTISDVGFDIIRCHDRREEDGCLEIEVRRDILDKSRKILARHSDLRMLAQLYFRDEAKHLVTDHDSLITLVTDPIANFLNDTDDFHGVQDQFMEKSSIFLEKLSDHQRYLVLHVDQIIKNVPDD